MGFFEAGEGRIDKGGKIDSGPMFAFDVISGETIFWPVAERYSGVLEFMRESESSSEGWIIGQGIDAAGVRFEVVTPLNSYVGVAGWEVFLLFRSLILD